MHLFSARFKELNGDVSGARAEYEHLYSVLCPGYLEAIVKHSNMEHRLVRFEQITVSFSFLKHCRVCLICLLFAG
jgi:hypothetical protein